MSQLTELRRAAFFSFEVEGYRGEEIAQLESVALDTVYTRLQHALRDFSVRVRWSFAALHEIRTNR